MLTLEAIVPMSLTGSILSDFNNSREDLKRYCLVSAPKSYMCYFIYKYNDTPKMSFGQNPN